MARYNKEFKSEIQQRMLPPNNEAVSQIAKETGVSEATLYKWRTQARANGYVAPNNKKVEQRIVQVSNQPEYKSLPPSQMVPRLADEGVYLASESTIYRVLHEHRLQHHRGRSAKPVSKPITTHYAIAPNQVWMWDISWCTPR